MMQRAFWRRALAALMGCWFTLASVEPVPLHPCAMHDGPAGAAVQAAVLAAFTAGSAMPATAAAPARHEAEHGAAHAAHATQHDAHHADPAAAAVPAAPASHDHDGGCLCIGCCTGAPALAAAPAAPLAWLAALRLHAPQLDPHGASFAPAPRDDVALPFPVGPPARVA